MCLPRLTWKDIRDPLPFEIMTKAVDLPSAKQKKNFLGITKRQAADNTSLHGHIAVKSWCGDTGQPPCRARISCRRQVSADFQTPITLDHDSTRTSGSEGCTRRHRTKHIFLGEPINQGPSWNGTWIMDTARCISHHLTILWVTFFPKWCQGLIEKLWLLNRRAAPKKVIICYGSGTRRGGHDQGLFDYSGKMASSTVAFPRPPHCKADGTWNCSGGIDHGLHRLIQVVWQFSLSFPDCTGIHGLLEEKMFGTQDIFFVSKKTCYASSPGLKERLMAFEDGLKMN